MREKEEQEEKEEWEEWEWEEEEEEALHIKKSYTRKERRLLTDISVKVDKDNTRDWEE